MKLKDGHKLRIGTNTYVFRWMTPEWMDDCKLQGQCDSMGQYIKLATSASVPIMSFLHEVIHAIEIDHSLDLKEQDVKILADHIVAFCRDNSIDLREDLEAGNGR